MKLDRGNTMNPLRRRLLIAGGCALAVPILWHLVATPRVSTAIEDDYEHEFAVTRTPAQWRAQLTERQFEILRLEATEPRGSSPLLKEKRRGTYHCAGCDQAVFRSETKYDSRTGWPSFWAPIEDAIGTREDRSLLFVVRTEVHCSRCGGHLGHVFEDGPRPTGLRYCINGAALTFVPA
ncbi:MAG: peptide-methionine (R)-S-oxide reductase MsrB [Nitrococcus mobilis]|nr:peptide-methionine (R)-S-oxide reductase MsrB [Nitrococcus mobilis]